MTAFQQKQQLAGRLKTVQDAQKRISEKMQSIQAQLKKLKNVPGTQPWVSFGRVRKTALQNTRDFKKRLEKALKDAEKSGQLDENELKNLLNESEHILEGFVNLLDANPSEDNIGLVFSEMEVPFLLGCDSDSGVCGRALQSAAKAAKTLYERDEQQFRKNPDVNNFSKMLGSKARGYLVGTEFDEKTKNWKGAPPGKIHPVAT